MNDPIAQRGALSARQISQLLQPINPRRVLKANGQSHLSQQDVTAHLTRILGFGHYQTDILETELIFEQPTVKIDSNTGQPKPHRYDVCYRAAVRLTIFDEDMRYITHWEDVSTGDAENQTRAAAHDLALKSAISLAKKRCSINLGDQFGLSLYNKGQTAALVIGTMVPNKWWEQLEEENPDQKQQQADMQADVPQQTSLGHTEDEPQPEEATQEQRAAAQAHLDRATGVQR